MARRGAVCLGLCLCAQLAGAQRQPAPGFEQVQCYMSPPKGPYGGPAPFQRVPCPSGYSLVWVVGPAAREEAHTPRNLVWELRINDTMAPFMPNSTWGRGWQIVDTDLLVCNQATQLGRLCPPTYEPQAQAFQTDLEDDIVVTPGQRTAGSNYTTNQTLALDDGSYAVLARVALYDADFNLWLLVTGNSVDTYGPHAFPLWGILLCTALGVLLAVAVVLVVVLWRKNRRLRRETRELRLQKYPRNKAPPTMDPSALQQVRGRDGPVPRSNFIALEEVGRGEFGTVYKGAVFCPGGPAALVAIKTLNERHFGQREAFLREAELMKRLQHSNVVSLVGVSEEVEGEPLCLLLEWLPLGDLATSLRRRTQCVGAVEGCWYAQNIACGMAYLASQGILHRDLAARNCMLAANPQGGLPLVKISDFGLARQRADSDYYRVGAKELLPVRWLALEAMTHRRYTQASDVWAFGVTVWEVFSNGATPYSDLQTFNLAVSIAAGARLACPTPCPPALYAIVESCWLPDPAARPQFATLVTTLQAVAPDMATWEGEGSKETVGKRASGDVQGEYVAMRTGSYRFVAPSMGSRDNGYSAMEEVRPVVLDSEQYVVEDSGQAWYTDLSTGKENIKLGER